MNGLAARDEAELGEREDAVPVEGRLAEVKTSQSFDGGNAPLQLEDGAEGRRR